MTQPLDRADASVSAIRRRVASKDLMSFMRIYLGHYMKHPSPPMHLEIASLLDEAARKRGARIAIAAPRDNAKSSLVSLAYVLRAICLGKEEYVLLISRTEEQAKGQLDHLKRELEGNLLLQQDFPEVCETPGIRPGPPRWTAREIITRNRVKVTALGGGTQIRGRRNDQHRPTLVILDDVEDSQEVLVPEQREKLWSWLTKNVMAAGSSRTNVIVVGTILHQDSLLATLVDRTRSPGWTGRVYKAVLSWATHPELWQQWEAIYSHRQEHGGRTGAEAARSFFEGQRESMLDGTRVAWPEKEPYYDLLLYRLVNGQASFDSEKQNTPVDPKDCLFPEAGFVYWDDRFRDAQELIESLKEAGYTVLGACDPSLGRSGREGDFTAIVILIRDLEHAIDYVVEADIRRRKPAETIEAILNAYKHWGCDAFAIETVQFQEMLAQEVQRRGDQLGIRPHIIPVDHRTDKRGRIQILQPLISRGAIRFSRRHRELLDQLRHFPRGTHDDGPDALEMAVSLPGARFRLEDFMFPGNIRESMRDDEGQVFHRSILDEDF